jgi:hypothetical protein
MHHWQPLLLQQGAAAGFGPVAEGLLQIVNFFVEICPINHGYKSKEAGSSN